MPVEPTLVILAIAVIVNVVIVLVAVVTVVGVVALWPDSGPVDRVRAQAPYAAPGVTTPDAEVLSVGPACPASASRAPQGCDLVRVKILEGAGKGQQASVRVPTEVATSGIGRGDHLELFRQPAQNGQPATYTYSTVRRAVAGRQGGSGVRCDEPDYSENDFTASAAAVTRAPSGALMSLAAAT